MHKSWGTSNKPQKNNILKTVLGPSKMLRSRKIRKDWGTLINWNRLQKHLNTKHASLGLDPGPINDIIRILGKILLESGDYMAILDQT